MSLRDFEFDAYFGKLRECLEASSGECKEIVTKIPDFLNLFVELLTDTEKVGVEERRLINAAISYTLAPYDVVPEKQTYDTPHPTLLKRIPFWARAHKVKTQGTKVYIDDAFLCTEVILRLKNRLDEGFLQSKWRGKEKDLDKIGEINKELKKTLEKDKRKMVLEYVGLKDK